MVVLDRRNYWLNNFNWLMIGAIAGYGFSTGNWWVIVAVVVASVMLRVGYFLGVDMVNAWDRVRRTQAAMENEGSDDPGANGT